MKKQIILSCLLINSLNAIEKYDINDLIDNNINNISHKEYIKFDLENIIKNTFTNSIQYQKMKINYKNLNCIKNNCIIKDLKLKTYSGIEKIEEINILFNENKNNKIKDILIKNLDNNFEKTELYKIENFNQMLSYFDDITKEKINKNYNFKLITKNIIKKDLKNIIFPINLLNKIPKFSRNIIINKLQEVYMFQPNNKVIYEFNIQKNDINNLKIDMDMELIKFKFNLNFIQNKEIPLSKIQLPITGKINYYIKDIETNIDISNFNKFLNSINNKQFQQELSMWKIIENNSYQKKYQKYINIYQKKSKKNIKLTNLYYKKFIKLKMFDIDKLNIKLNFIKKRHPISFLTYYHFFKNGNLNLFGNLNNTLKLEFN